MLGLHWIAEGEGCKPETLTEDNLLRALDDLPDAIGVTRVAAPQTYRHGDASLAGVVLIAESHIALHAFPKASRLAIDIFSCRPFPIDVAKRRLEYWFGVQSFREQTIQRLE